MLKNRDALLAMIAADGGLAALYQEVEGRMDSDPGHDLGHLQRVALWTVRLAGGTVPVEHCIAAALLHDIVNVPKNSPDRARTSEVCAEVAGEMMTRLGLFDSDARTEIQQAIIDHSFSRGAVPTSDLGRSLQDADRLEAVGAIGVARTFSTGSRMGASYFHRDDPWAHDRQRDDKAFTVDHFFEKLLRLAPTLLTAAGRAEAERRAEWMRGFLRQLGEEIGEAPPEALMSVSGLAQRH